jgi:hypothetical protein
VGSFGGLRIEVTATANSFEVRHLCSGAFFDEPLLPAEDGSFAANGVTQIPTAGEFAGAPARVQGDVSEDGNSITFVFEKRSNVTGFWIQAEGTLIVTRGTAPTWSGGSCIA